VQALRDRRRAERRPEGRSSRAVAGRIHRTDGRWAVPLPTVDPHVVARSGAALERYGPEFRYSHYACSSGCPWSPAAWRGSRCSPPRCRCPRPARP
jgi:hypothetical protein